ncbi:NlpC/P60 family protein [Erwinia sp. D4-22]
MNRKLAQTLMLVSFITLVGCSSSPGKNSAKTQQADDISAQGEQADLIPVIAALHDQMHTWHGTPYEWGGTKLSGVDCSGFVWRTLKDRFNLPVERLTTRDLIHMGTHVTPKQLRPGDLVFFRINGGMHVGFYDTDRHFLHASTSKGVIRSSLDNPYWRSVFYQARRLNKEYDAGISLNNDGMSLSKRN